jgi:hypothetical protein
METKIPQNPKYSNVKSTLNTGFTKNNIELISFVLKIGDKMLAKRKGENFSRLRPSTIARLVTTDTNPESIYNINQDEV